MGETAVIVIWFVVMFPCLILVAALLTNDAKPKKNIILGVTLPLLAQSATICPVSLYAVRKGTPFLAR